jgi:CPA1 family monovalent cation:H+ antiporter
VSSPVWSWCWPRPRPSSPVCRGWSVRAGRGAGAAGHHHHRLADADFDAQREALGKAVAERRLDEETARQMIEDIDLRQAAANSLYGGRSAS